MKDNYCPRCGAWLPTVTVRVPVKLPAVAAGGHSTAPIIRYEEREEVADCIRCTGSR